MQEKKPGKKIIDLDFRGIVDRHPELAIPLIRHKHEDRIRYKKRPKTKFRTNSY